MKKLIMLAAGGLIVAGIVYVNHRLRGEPTRLSWGLVPPAPIQVDIQKPTRRPITHRVTAPGTVYPIVEIEISSRVVGQIVKLPVKEGDTVKAGDVLARLESADYEARVRSGEARVERLKAAIRQTEVDLEKADRDARRYQDLALHSAASHEEVANSQTLLARQTAARDMARQELIEAQAALDSAQEDLRRTVITAPIDGVVAQILTEEGEVLIPGTMNLPGAVFMVISDLARMEVKTQIDESDVALVRPGQRAWIYLTTDDQVAIPGTVQRVTPKGVKLAEVTTFETRILVESSEPRIRSGMTANVEIEVRRRAEALTVPIQAVRHRRRKDLPTRLGADVVASTASSAPSRSSRSRDPEAEYLKVVFVVEEGQAQPRLVRTDISDDNYVEIIDGLSPDDRIITGPYRVLDVLKAGQPVQSSAPPGSPATKPATSTAG